MRGLAAIAVMMDHLTYANQNFADKMPSLSLVFSNGHLGVWAFFVISGFVIPHSMLATDYNFPCGAWPYFVRRVVRLEPPYAVAVLMAIAVAFVATLAPGYRGPPFHLDAMTFFTQFFYLAPWFGKEWINVVSWTLALEFQYYILMLFIAPLLLSQSRAMQWCFLFLVTGLSFASSDGRIVFLYLPCFAVGFSAFLYFQARISIATFGALLMAFSILTWLNLGVGAAVVAAISAGLIFFPVRSPMPILSFFGTISFSLYLVHAFIGGRIINLTTRLPDDGWVQIGGLALAAGASIIIAYSVWLIIEKPSIKAARAL